jgi:regulatory subunit for Cdc7p protein kinase
MSTLSRNPLSSRSFSNHYSASASSWKGTLLKSSSVKRTRSPEPSDVLSVKRSKALQDSSRSAIPIRDDARRRETKEPKEERERKRNEREEEFRVKYSRAFPNWVFYFDLDALEPETAVLRKEYEKLVLHMGAVRVLACAFTC